MSEQPQDLSTLSDSELFKQYPAVREYWRRERDKKREEDEQERDDPELRLYSVKLILLFDELLSKVAKKWGEEHGHDNPFEADARKWQLLWSFGEFITGSVVESWDFEAHFTKPFQLTLAHACHHFDCEVVEEDGKRRLVALDRE